MADLHAPIVAGIVGAISAGVVILLNRYMRMPKILQALMIGLLGYVLQIAAHSLGLDQ